MWLAEFLAGRLPVAKYLGYLMAEFLAGWLPVTGWLPVAKYLGYLGGRLFGRVSGAGALRQH